MPSHAIAAGLFAVLSSGVAAAQSPTSADAQVLPARFEADRVYVTPTTHDGDVLRLYTDSGGGLYLTQATVDRLALSTRDADESLRKEVGAEAKTATLPAFQAGKSIPPPLRDDARFLVMPARMKPLLPGLSLDDGMLGQAWFDGRVWTWDYPARQFRLEGDAWTPVADLQRVALSFKTDASGKRENAFPGIDVTVDGQRLPMLLDTGAMTVLTPQALARVADDMPAERATSMIVDSLFQAWRKAHPDWRVIESAQAGTGSAMIEVPLVEIAGQRVGPVWFTQRNDANFHDFMASLLGHRVEGAIGGNALGHFVMTVDYPGAAAYFRCVRGCMAAAASQRE